MIFKNNKMTLNCFDYHPCKINVNASLLLQDLVTVLQNFCVNQTQMLKVKL